MQSNPKYRVLIVDDEALARERLRSLLRAEEGFDIAAECSDGRQAVEAIRRERPDLVFMDIQMPELDGFGVLDEIGPSRMPPVIFVTAFDQFAVRAFDVHAVDYILKPYDAGRFQKALDRVRVQLEQKSAPGGDPRLVALAAEVKANAKTPDRIAVRAGGKVVLVRIEEIDWVESADNYVVLHLGADRHMIRETMAAMETRLPVEKFVRISRSVIVNVDRIRELQPLFHGEYSVVLRGGAKLTLSRGYREKLNHLLGRES